MGFFLENDLGFLSKTKTIFRQKKIMLKNFSKFFTFHTFHRITSKARMLNFSKKWGLRQNKKK